MGVYVVNIKKDWNISYEGPFIFQNIVNKFFDLLRERGYAAPDVVVNSYSEKINDDGSRDVSISIDGAKSINDYIKYAIGVELSFSGMKRIVSDDIDIDWGKVNLKWGKLLINFDSSKRIEFLGKANNILSKILGAAYEYFIVKGELDANVEGLIEDVEYISNRLLEELNSYRFYERKIKEIGENKNLNKSK